jgi:shikimate dehydrogenase|tara:strand:- start:559 stop:1389 length:831 start_codon:yes stop_codon:yes gene_type:complete
MNKKKYAIIGNPVAHSLSPVLHNYWFNKYKINAEYSLLNIRSDQIQNVINQIRQKIISGINVTLPYKQKVIPFIEKKINDAEESGSVNTIYLNKEEKIIGENTDVYGLQAAYFMEIMENKALKKKVLIIGAGGVSPSIIVALKKSNISDITIINRTYEKCLFLKKNFPGLQILKWADLSKSIKLFDIIINATSLGLKNGYDFEFLFDDCKDNMIYIDTIYNPIQTRMVKHLRKKEIKTYNGLDMFIYQGQKSFYLWNKINPEIDQELINLLLKNLK